MDVTREIELAAPPEEVWEALTDADQLAEWFANDVELDPEPGGEGTFRWDNGEVRRAVVEEVVPLERFTFTWDDSRVEIELEEIPAGTPRDGRRIARRRVVDRVGAACLRAFPASLPDVFEALGDPSRRFPPRDAFRARGGDRDRARRRVAGDATGGVEAPRRARARRARDERAARGRETQYPASLPAPLEDAIEWMARVGGEWDARLARLRKHPALTFRGGFGRSKHGRDTSAPKR